MIKFACGIAAIAALLLPAIPAIAQEKTAISITRQPGILYLASHVMETQKLIEKDAEKLGLKGVTVEWRTFSGGGAQTDALLAGMLISSTPEQETFFCFGIAPRAA